MNTRMLAFGAVAAVVLAAGHFFGDLPSARSVQVRLTDRQIDKIELEWQEDDETVHVTELGPPFDSMQSRVTLSDGPHRLLIRVHRGAEVDSQERRIDVMGDTERIVLDVP